MAYLVDGDLIIKYLAGRASAEEALAIDEWRKASHVNAMYFDEIWQTWHEALDVPYVKPNISDTWAKMQVLSKQPSSKLTLKRNLWKPALAAALVLFIGMGIWWKVQDYTSANGLLAIHESKNDTSITLNNGFLVNLSRGATLTESGTKNNAYNLTGAAYFDDGGVPGAALTLDLGKGLQLTDIGTHFYVDNNDKELIVKVFEGSVKVWNSSSQFTVLPQGTLKYDVQNDVFTQGPIIADFQLLDQPLAEVVNQVKWAFNVDVRWNDTPDLSALMTIQGGGMSLSEVITVIAETFNYKYSFTNHGQTVTFSKY